MSTLQAAERPADASPSGRTYDQAERKQGKRSGREKGCWTYLPASVLVDAGLNPDDDPPFYRTVGFQRSRNGHTVIVSLYREP